MEQASVRKVMTHLLVAAVVTLVAAAPAATAAQGKEQQPAPIDINKASVEELQELPGVGPSLAQRIVEFREEHGPFASVDELLKVRGIGEKSLERFRHMVVAGKAK